jgi:hypothetical protein
VQAVLARCPGAEIVDVRPPPGAPASGTDETAIPPESDGDFDDE